MGLPSSNFPLCSYGCLPPFMMFYAQDDDFNAYKREDGGKIEMMFYSTPEG